MSENKTIAKSKSPVVNKNSKSDLPLEVEKFVLTQVAANNFMDLCDEYYFDIDRVQVVAQLFLDIFNKKVKVSSLPATMKKRLEIDKERADYYAEHFAGKYLLVADDYFDGEVVALIKKLGGNLEEYQKFSQDYLLKINEEIDKDKEEVESAEPQDEENPLLGLGEIDQENPEVDVKDMSELLKNHLLDVFENNDLLDRVDYNIVLTTLFLIDKKYHHQILQAILNNNEKLGDVDLKRNDEILASTIGNWLKDFDISTREEKNDSINTLSKARYYNGNANIKKLDEKQKEKLDKIFDLYENIKNFYQNAERMDLSDVQIFPFTDEEKKEFLSKYGQSVEKQTEKEISNTTKDIYELYMGDVKDREAMEIAEKEIIAETNKDKKKLADWLYREIIARHRINIIAGLKVAVEVGLLDDYVREEPDFVDLLEAHYKRNNMVKELEAYQADRSNPDNVRYFLKYILTERLGMLENHAARVAVQFSNIYRKQGVHELSQLAYFDVNSQEFKWL